MMGEANSSLQNCKEDWVTELTKMVKEGARFPEDSGFANQCIYRVPRLIRESNPEAYNPRVVSIGPFHNPFRSGGGDLRLKQMEELKLQYFSSFFRRTQQSVETCVSKLKELEPSIRQGYAEPIEYGSDAFVRMVLIDGCFIIEHFLRYYRMVAESWVLRDPLFSKPRLSADVFLDLILLENQLPFFVLTSLYDLAIAPDVTANNHAFPSFFDVTIKFFDPLNIQDKKLKNGSVLHFTDLLRTFMLPSSIEVEEQPYRTRAERVEHLYSARELLDAGLDFKPSQKKCWFDLNFDKGVLEMPCFKISDVTEVRIRNAIAFEQCHHPYSPYIVEYVKILDFLINDGKDVSVLVDKKILVNLLGDVDEVAKMINNLCSNVKLPNVSPGYRDLCDNLNAFYENPSNKYKAVFIRDYFNTPWKIASTSAAIVLLFLTLIQTVFSVISFFVN